MQKKLYYSLIQLVLSSILMIGLMNLGYSAEADQPDSQAMEQLRMFQKRLSESYKKNHPDNANTANKPLLLQPPSRPSTKQSETTVVTTASTSEKKPVEDAPPDDEVIDRAAFKETKRQLFPLSATRVKKIRKMYQDNEYAIAEGVGTPPKPTATSQFVNLSPGSTPPVIRLSQGFVSSLVFLDSTGAPWPITAYDLGDANAFNIQWDKTSNTLMIQAMKLYTYGNLAVRLKGLNTPVMLTLIPGQKAVDYRVDLRIQGLGPNAPSAPMEEGLPPSANNLLLHVLEGVPPAGSQRLTVTGGDARAWLFKEKIYVRTNLLVLSPGWISSMTSADGMHAYELQKTPVLLVSWHGKVMQLKIEGL